MRYLVTASLVAVLIASEARPAAAQDPAAAARIATDGVEIVTGLMDFDLAGTGQAIPFVFRVSRSVATRLALEFDVTMASPDQQFGSSQILLTEGKASWSWRIGRVRPFVSGGGGVMAQNMLTEIRWRPTFTGGGGARIGITDNLYAIAEMRLRGISTDFSASTAEWLGGVGWRLR